MVDYTDVRIESLSMSFFFFFFARLGVYIEYSGGQHCQVGLFVIRDCALRPVLLKLYPLTCHFLIWNHLAS